MLPMLARLIDGGLATVYCPLVVVDNAGGVLIMIIVCSSKTRQGNTGWS